jgi:hypothetical protein
VKNRYWYLLPVIGARLLAYSNSFTGSSFHDDFGSIPENPTIRHLWPIWRHSLSGIGCVLEMGSKEAIASAPLMALLYGRSMGAPVPTK